MPVQTAPAVVERGSNRMHPLRWVPAEARSLLDVGCNDGALLGDVRRAFPAMRLAAVEINPSALATARRALPGAELHQAGADRLPFPDGDFDCVTCIEVLEHIPEALRAVAIREMRRVLRPDGRLVLRTPHAGTFSWLDTNNYRFRCPWLYRALVGRGLRDAGYPGGAGDVVWHHHFTQAELLAVAGAGWEVEAVCHGGLLLFPLADLLSWPFYRLRCYDNGLLRMIHRVADFDYGCDYGRASYGILLALRRT
jgi:SAM-dependent methyltransferase